MRVVQLITQDRGGPVDHAVDVATELARLGHESHLVGPNGPYMKVLSTAGVQVHDAAMSHKTDLTGARRVRRTLIRIAPDVVHCQDRRAGLVGRLVCGAARLPSVYTLHGVPDSLAPLVPGNIAVIPESRRDQWANLTGERLLARTPRSMVVTPCEALASYAREHVGLRPDRVVSVANGVSAAWLSGAGAETNADATGPVTLAWLGVMQPVKRLPALIRAVAQVPDLRLRLIGDGPERATVEATIRETGTGDRVELVGFQSDPAAHLRDVDGLVLPSAAEACPMAVLQAMALGLPVIASRAGGIPEVIRHGVDGLLVDTGDDQDLQSALQLLADDRHLRRTLGDNARLRAQSRYTVETCTRGLLDVYGQVAR